ncbi:MAG: class II aldolase/adducin family protein [Phycisphaerales bacterium]|nr:class II aldolase/adducin family protein [Phycisphaerales bacterium]
MDSVSVHARREALLALSRELGREDRKLAILGEGNASTRVPTGGGGPVMADGRFLIKASGRSLGTLAADGVVLCESGPLLDLMNAGSIDDERVDAVLLESRVDQGAAKPSVEAIFHAYLLSLAGVEWVGHTHPVSVNRILCSPRAAEFAMRRIFPDEVVCCGEESVLVPYTDPGLKLAIEIRRGVEGFRSARGTNPRVILLESHGVITLGRTDSAVLAGMLMMQKSAEIWMGAAALGGPVFLDESDVRRIAGRTDEHYRQRALNL